MLRSQNFMTTGLGFSSFTIFGMNLFRDGSTKKIKKSILKTFADIGENGIDEKALDIILEGWNMVDEKQTCLSFHTDEEYIYNLLFFAEKYGLTEANIQTKEIDDKVERIIEMPLGYHTEMKALFVYLSVKILNINHKKKIWNNSDMDFRNKNKDNYCMETEELINGSYSIETLEDLMELYMD